MLVCVCVFVRACVCAFVCVCVLNKRCTYIRPSVHIHMYVHTWPYIRMCIYSVCTYIGKLHRQLCIVYIVMTVLSIDIM